MKLNDLYKQPTHFLHLWAYGRISKGNLAESYKAFHSVSTNKGSIRQQLNCLGWLRLDGLF